VAWGLWAWLTALALLPACAASGPDSAQTSTSRTPTTPGAQAVSSAPATATARATQSSWTEKWIDLQVGECLADPPPTDPSVLTVPIVDCATPHQAEVYFRAPVAVDAAIAKVANRECAARFAQYTGESPDGSRLAVTYLIDSNQDRTSANPTPSTVICLLQAADGRPLTASARHRRQGG
jgi:hypothetical protein